MDTTPPPVAAEIAARLTAAGWSVRRLRERGFSGSAAEALLGKGASLPSLATADAALALLGHRLSHKRDLARKPVDPEA
jgi:hypothetical protein